jgi:O-antigen/teichoic acid export membrane protein
MGLYLSEWLDPWDRLNASTMRHLINDVAVYFLGRSIPAAIGIVAVWILIRLLGETGYGSYAILTSGSNLLSVLAVGWLSQGVLRYQPSAPDQEPFRLALAIALLLVCLATLVGSLAIAVLDRWSPDPLIAFASVFLLAMSSSVHAAYAASLQAALRPRAVATAEIVRACIGLPLAVVGAAYVNPPFIGATLALGLSYALSGALCFVLSAHSMPAGPGRNEALALTRRLFVFGWPISIWLAISLLFPFTERMIIERLLGTGATGQYAAMYDTVYRGCGFLLLPIVLAAHPRIMGEHVRRDREAVVKLWRASLLLQLGVGCAATIVLVVIAPWIVLLAGFEPGPAEDLVLPLAGAGCAWQAALVAQKLLEVEQRTTLMLSLLVVALGLCIGVDILLLPTFGTVGAAYSLLLSGAFYAACTAFAGLSLTGSNVSTGETG